MSALLLSVLLLSALTSSVTCSELAGQTLRRAGPSGYVIFPAGGANFLNLPGSTDDMLIEYHGITTDQCNSRCYTTAIDLYLEDTNDNYVATLANGWAGDFSEVYDQTGMVITGSFLTPPNVCGQFRLVFREYQLWDNSNYLSFISAAPTVNFQCTLPTRDIAPAAEARDGPSGYVMEPAGGTTYYSSSAEPQSSTAIYAEYHGAPCDGQCNTYAVDIWLRDENENYVATLANRLEGSDNTADPNFTIIGSFVIPPGACGPLQLAFREYQWYGGEMINFISAAPSIYVDCS